MENSQVRELPLLPFLVRLTFRWTWRRNEGAKQEAASGKVLLVYDTCEEASVAGAGPARRAEGHTMHFCSRLQRPGLHLGKGSFWRGVTRGVPWLLWGLEEPSGHGVSTSVEAGDPCGSRGPMPNGGRNAGGRCCRSALRERGGIGLCWWTCWWVRWEEWEERSLKWPSSQKCPEMGQAAGGISSGLKTWSSLLNYVVFPGNVVFLVNWNISQWIVFFYIWKRRVENFPYSPCMEYILVFQHFLSLFFFLLLNCFPSKKTEFFEAPGWICC